MNVKPNQTRPQNQALKKTKKDPGDVWKEERGEGGDTSPASKHARGLIDLN